MPESHLKPYIDEPFGAIQTIIAAATGKGDKVDGIHAGLGLADYGALTILDKHAMNAVDCHAWSDTAIAAKIDEACPCPKEGMKAIDWSAVWSDVKPLVFQLIQRWLFS